ncbi:MAG: RlmE family RNA methyltransferase [Neomegalonema sp.]|nr:RlmE family RNA methyltransferase [Neomegalonema sp.]
MVKRRTGAGGGKSGAGKQKPGKGAASRDLKVRVKTARGRKLSSTRWLQRQLNDPYVHRAQREGYVSRAAFKLLEIDERFQILRPGRRIVDLGAAPGGWCQVAVAKVNALGDQPGKPVGSVLGVDLQEMQPIAGADLMQLDFLEPDADARVMGRLGGPVDAVLSDMAPFTTGHKQTDHLRIVACVEAAAQFAEDVLAPGGIFVAKVLQGGTEQGLLAHLKKRFEKAVHFKPPSSRKDSAEMFLVAQGFRGGQQDDLDPESPDPKQA